MGCCLSSPNQNKDWNIENYKDIATYINDVENIDIKFIYEKTISLKTSFNVAGYGFAKKRGGQPIIEKISITTPQTKVVKLNKNGQNKINKLLYDCLQNNFTDDAWKVMNLMAFFDCPIYLIDDELKCKYHNIIQSYLYKYDPDIPLLVHLYQIQKTYLST